MSRAFANEEAIFTDALARPPAERGAFLAEACAGNAALLARLTALLAAHDSADSCLDRPAVPTPAFADPEGQPGTRIGRYLLRERLGEGGCGVVFLAEQCEPVRRPVAVKVIKPGMDTREVLARFDAERQALALMNHPHIARVFDAGTTAGGRPYFVMEVARGEPLTRFCDNHRLPPGERLGLFVHVCRAIQHAHQKGIIHRDLKPSNIPVVFEDGIPVPKVIDFGIAKAIHGRLTDLTIFTSVEQLLGTPAYMSPEQILRNGDDVDTRSDIYSLGVLLYELLTGGTPLDRDAFRQAGWEERQQLICDRDAVRPSTWLRHLPPARAAAVAAQHGMDPSRLVSLLQGDLDWIVMKCLEKDRARRYETAAALADDIQRHLRHEPVAASPPGRVYRMRKLIRRHQIAFITAAVVLLTLCLGVVASRWQAVRALRAERAQHALRERAEASAARALAEEQNARATRREAQWRAYSAEMLLAHEAYLDGKVRRARALLEKHAPAAGVTEDLRGFEWRYLWRLCAEGDALASLHAHDGPVSMVAFAGRDEIITCDFQGAVRAHDSVSLAVRREVLAGRDGRPTSDQLNDYLTARSARHLILAPNGGFAAAAVPAGGIRVWRLAEPTAPSTLPVNEPAQSLCFDPTGRLLGISLPDRVELWETGTGRILDRIPRPAVGQVQDISADGETVLTRATLGPRLWSRREKSLRLNLPFAHTSYATALVLSPDQEVIATASWDTTIKLWDASDGRLLAQLVGHRGHVWCLAFSPDGAFLASGGGDDTVRVWAVGAPGPATLRRVLRGHLADVTTVAFSRDGTQLVSGDTAGIIKLWPREEQAGRDVVATHADWAFALAFSPRDDRRLASAGFGGTAWIRDLDRDTHQDLAPPRTYDTFNLTWSADGRFLATGEGYWGGKRRQPADPPGTIRLWEAATGRELFHLPLDEAIAALAHPYPIKVNHPKMEARAPAISPDGRSLACGINAGWIQIWRLPDFVRTRSFHACESIIQGLQYSPDGRWLAAVEGEGPTRILDTATWREVACLDQDPNLGWGSPIAFSPDSALLAFGSRRVWLWPASTRDPTPLPEGHNGPIMTLCFSPDGRTLATGSMDHTVKLWSLLTRQEVATLRGHTGPVSGLSFSADGTLLASSSQDQTVRLWRAAPAPAAAP